MKLNIPATQYPELDKVMQLRIAVSTFELENTKFDHGAHIKRMMADQLAHKLIDYCAINQEKSSNGHVSFEASLRIGDFFKEQGRTEKLMERIRLLQSELRSADAQIQSLKWLNNNGIKETS
jgi:FMN phosphatase YigB (HAD superfamily)